MGFPWSGACTHFAENIDVCQTTPPLNCSGSCYVMYGSEATDSEPEEVTMVSVEVVGTLIGLVLTAIGSMSLCMSSACCFCIRLTKLTESNTRLKSNVMPMSIGAPQTDGAYKKRPFDTSKLERGISVCFSFAATLLTFFAAVGVIFGIHIAAVLKYFHNRELAVAGKALP